MTCGNCTDCPMANTTGDIYYEIHITVENDKYFIETCEEFGMKPIIIAFGVGSNTPAQVMATKVLKGNFLEAYDETNRLSRKFEDRKWKVIRQKIETVPWNPLAQTREGYFEAHFACVPFYVDHDHFFKKFELHKSFNLLKKGQDQYQMLTYRSKEDLHSFEKSVYYAETYLKIIGIDVKKVIKEFCVFDTNVKLDDDWLNL